MALQVELHVNSEKGGFHTARILDGDVVNAMDSSQDLATVLVACVAFLRRVTTQTAQVTDYGRKLLRTTNVAQLSAGQLNQYVATLARAERGKR